MPPNYLFPFMSKGSLIIVSAPSGAGKTSLTRALIERLKEQGQEAQFSVSYTTRKPRPGEIDGQDYHFISEEIFLGMIDAGEFLEHAEVFGRRYGTCRSATQAAIEAGQILFMDIDWQGARQVKQRLPDAVSVFIRPPDEDTLIHRLLERGQDSPEVIAERMHEAQAEMSHMEEFDHVIVNDQFEAALDAFEKVIRSL